MATDTVTHPNPVTRATNELRVCRGFMDGITEVLDGAGEGEAAESLRLSLDSLGDCLDSLEKPEQPTQQFHRPTIADDIRMDRQMDVDRGEV